MTATEASRLALAGLAGLAGTAAMATTTLIEKRLLHHPQPIDYDDSSVLVDVASRFVPLDVSGPTASMVNQAMRFAYGSVGGLVRHALDGRVRRPALGLLAFMSGGEMISLWALGVAPPPWRWKRSVLVSSVLQHVVYVVGVEVTYRAAILRHEDPSLAFEGTDTER